jgi:predicted RNA-binding Zn ribbon-like protein
MNTPETVNLLGNSLSLDFANSVDWSADGRPTKDEVLETPDDLRRWGVRLGIGDTARKPTARELERALALRTALHSAFAAIAQGGEPAPAHLKEIARQHAEAVAAARLERADDGAVRFAWPASEPRRTRFAVVADAVAVLADPERVRRLRHCPGHDCGWVFLDLSGRRRWCSMDTCGSRAKMRRLYERQRRGAAGQSRAAAR